MVTEPMNLKPRPRKAAARASLYLLVTPKTARYSSQSVLTREFTVAASPSTNDQRYPARPRA